nr:zinc transporter ZntB [Govania unica]
MDGQGGGTPLSLAEVTTLPQPTDPWVWAHFDGSTAAAKAWLEQESGLPALVIAALLKERTRPRVEVFEEEGVLINLRGTNSAENAVPEDMVSVRLWISGRRVITVRLRPLRTVNDLRDRIEAHVGPRSGGDVLTSLALSLIDRMSPILEALNIQLDLAEDSLIHQPKLDLRRRIVTVRRRVIMMRRHIAPQREVVAVLKNSHATWFTVNDRRHLHEAYDRMALYVDDLDTMRERSQIIQDELTSYMNARLNRNTYLLSLIASIFLPLTFVTGLFGINVGGIPGSDNPSAFGWFVGSLVVVMVIQFVVLRAIKWF